MTKKPIIVIHGGAGTILKSEMTASKEMSYTSALKNSANAGFAILQNQGTAIQAITAAVMSMEDCHLFNAGIGSVFNSDGTHEMDAAIMDGQNGAAGSVAGIRGIKNPVLLAKEVMGHSEHVLLIGRGAEKFAESRDFEMLPDEYFFDQYRFDQWRSIKDSGEVQLDHSKQSQKLVPRPALSIVEGSSKDEDQKYGTVGAVALDQFGNLAAATSTGGLTNKKFGRLGDSPIIGVGNYANNKTCAISCTGHGEYIMRGVVAYDVSCLMEYKGLSLQKACEHAIFERLASLGGDGGAIAVDQQGDFAMVFNSPGMYRAYQCEEEGAVVKIYRN